MLTRIGLFIATNLAVLLLVSIIMSVLGVSSRSMAGLLIMATCFGFGGSFISLLLSKWMAKRGTGAVVITQPQNATERWLLDTVARQAKAAGIGMPEVAVYEAPEINAFATGANRNNALVAVSTGLLHSMTEDEAEAVLAHEVAHVANGDMITMTLLQGVLNTFVIILARIVGGFIDSALSGDEDSEDAPHGFAYFIIVFVLEMIFGVFASMIAMWFSRWREFRADHGGASLAGRHKMIAALERLQRNHEESSLPSQIAAFGIASGPSKLFSSHPPLEDRIAALRNLTIA